MSTSEGPQDRRPPAWAVTLPVLAVLLVAGGVLAARSLVGRDDPPPPEVTTSTSASETSTTTTTTSAVAAVDRSTSLFPDTTMTERFDDPVEVVRAFATRYLDMKAPSLSDYREGEPGAGEVAIRPKPGRGPTTTATVRRLGGEDGGWHVTSASSENLQLDTPDPLDTITSPVSVAGRSRAFEATVGVAVREDGQLGDDFLAKGFYTGGGGGADLEPFRHQQEFPTPTRRNGALLLLVYSAEDGSVAEATVVRVRLAP